MPLEALQKMERTKGREASQPISLQEKPRAVFR